MEPKTPTLSPDKDIRIDPDALDLEWLRQSNLTYRYARLLADARRDNERAKERLELVRATLRADIRKFPENYDMAKPTDVSVDAKILECGGYQEALGEFNATRYDMDLIWAAVNAIEAKKTALENLVRLLGMNYFSAPKEPRRLVASTEDPLPPPSPVREAVRNAVRERMIKRRRT